MTSDQSPHAAFQRLLAEAHNSGQAKVDALVALVQRTVHVVPWPGDIEGFRTLVNSEGVAALPIFTDSAQLVEASRRYGWMDASGAPADNEIGARAALNHAIQQNLAYVVIDIAASHSLELAREEFEPLLTPAARRESAGPYAGTGRVSSSLIRAVRSSSAPPPRGNAMSATGTISAPEISVPETVRGGAESTQDDGFTASAEFSPDAAATFGGGSSVTLHSMSASPDEAVYEAVVAVLRDYPEVEWACMVGAARGPGEAAPTVGVRVDTGFRQRVNQIIAEVRRAGQRHGASLDVLLLDDATLTRTARSEGEVFYPWRKR